MKKIYLLVLFLFCCRLSAVAVTYAVASAVAPVGTSAFCKGATVSGSYTDVWTRCNGTGGTTGAITYQWKLDGAAISGATGTFTASAAATTGTVTLTSIPGASLSALTAATHSLSVTYTWTVTTTGCTSPVNSAVLNLIVSANPTVTVTPSSGSRCSAAAATAISAAGATTYAWSPATGLSATTGASPSTSITAAGNTVYTVTGTTGSCTNTATYTISVTATPVTVVSPSSASRCSAATATAINGSGATTYTWSPSTGLSATTGATPSTSIATTGNTIYTVTGTTSGCSSTATYTITVAATPTVTVSPSSATRCSAAAATTINGAGATTYVWSPATGLSATTGASPSTSVTASGNTIYTVTGTTGSCNASATYTISVTTTPTVAVTPSSSVLCAGVGQSLTASGATAYSWSPVSGLSATIGSPVTATPSSSTVYTVTGYNGGCTANATANVAVNGLPYFESFENGTTDVPANNDIPSCMGVTSTASYRDNTWTAATGSYNLEPEAGSGFASFGHSAANDYFYTPGFLLTSGNTYQFSFWYITDGNGGSSGAGEYNATIKYGTSQTSAAMTHTITGTSLVNFNNTTYQRWAGTFVAPSTGTYYIGINAANTSGSSSEYWSFDSLYLEYIPACAAPTSRATSVSCSGTTGTSTTVSFTAASPAVDSYLVVASTSSVTPVPVSGTSYSIGAALGSGYVVGLGNSSPVTTSSGILSGATSYYLYVYSYNALGCIGGPDYYTTPATSSFATCMDPPSVTDTSSGAISLNWTAAPGATSYSITVYADPYLSTMVGSPHNAGTATSYTVTGLIPSTTYYFTITPAGTSCTAASGASSGTTLATLPYYQGFENLSTEGNLSPNGMQGNSQIGDGFSTYGGEDNGFGFYPINTGTWDYMFQGIWNGGYTYSWLVTPGMYLTPGTYTFSYYYNTDDGGGEDWASLTAQISTNGTLPSNTSATMSGSPVTIGTAISPVTATTWTQSVNTVTISTAAIYYIGLVAASESSSSYLVVDDIAFCTQPSITTISGSPDPICQNATLSLTATTTGASGYTYSWSGPDAYSAATQSATVASVSATPVLQVYTLTVSSDPVNTCSITATTTTTVSAAPSAISPSAETICPSSSFTFSGGGTGTWTSSNTSLATVNSSGQVTSTATAGGIASPVTITYSNSCGTAATATLYTANTMGGTYNVGVGQTFPTITSAVEAYNLSCIDLTGTVTFLLTDAGYGSETLPITINSNATASSTSRLVIKPASGVSPVISGSSSSAIFVLNGAQYVTIEGAASPVTDDVCPAAASSQNMTINNSSSSTSSAVVWLSSGAKNDTVRNCNITGSGISGTLVGIGSGGSASSISLTSTGSSNNNNAIVNNNISYVYAGVYSMGASAASKNTGTLISQNTMSASAGLGAYGIFTGFENGVTISGNSISGITASTVDAVAINIGFANNAITNTATTGNDVINASVTDNIISGVSQSGGYSASGIAMSGVASGTATIADNEVSGVLGNSSGSDFTSGIFIGGVSGSTVDVWYNAVDLTGSGGTGTTNTYATAVSGASSTVKIQDNLLINTITNSTSNSAYGLGLAYNTYTNLTSNYNDFYTGSGTKLFGVGSLSAPSATYTSVATWHTASAEDNTSLNALPAFNSSSDLRLSYGGANTSFNNSGTPVSITTDINCATRSSSTPDMGVNEFGGSSIPPVITYTVLPNTCSTGNISLAATITDASGPGIQTTGVNVPQVYFRKNSGTWYHSAGTAGSGSTWNFTIASSTMGGLSGGEVISYYVVAQDVNTTPIVASYPVGVTATTVNSVTAAPSPNSYRVGIGSGSFNVGVGQLFTTITAAVDSYNTNACLSGPVTYLLTASSYPGETFPITINNNAYANASNTLTIMPASGISPVISGNNSTAIFVFNDAQYVTIDGSNSPVTNSVCPASASVSNMIISNSSTNASSAVIWLASGASGNIIRNCTITGNAITTTLFGIGSGGSSSSIAVTSTGASNNNNSFINNTISLVQNGIYTMGASSSSKNSGTIINQNTMTASNGIGSTGILAGFENNITISGNSISNIVNSTTSVDVVAINAGFPYNGIYLTTPTGNDVTNATITNNRINNISQGYSYSAIGIALAGVTTGTTTVANNMISGVISNGVSTKFSSGIWVGGASGSVTDVFYNSVSNTGNLIGGSSPTFAIAVSSDPVVYIKNNIFVNAAVNGSGFTYAIGLDYSSYSTLYANNNDFYSGASLLGCVGSLEGTGTSLSALSDWQSTTGTDDLSVNVNPIFTSASDLELTTSDANVAMNNSGAVVAVTEDIDCNTRNATHPDMGVNEFTPNGCTSADGGTITATATSFCTPGTPTLSLAGGSGYTTGYGTSYQWRSATAAAGPWTNISGATSTTYLPTVLSNTYFQMLVSCSNTGTTDTAAASVVISVSAQPSLGALSASHTALCSGSSLSLSSAASGGAGTAIYTWQGPGLATATSSVSPLVFTPTVSATASGAYTLSLSYSGASCSVTPTVTSSVVTVYPQPVLTVTPSVSALCTGASFTLNAATSASGIGSAVYTWSGPAGIAGTTSSSASSSVISPALVPTASVVAGTFSVAASYSVAGCSTVGTTTLTVGAHPSVSLSASPTVLCSGGVLSLTATPVGGAGTAAYTWSGPGIVGTTSTGVTPSYSLAPSGASSGAYSVSVSYTAPGCSSATAVSATVTPTVQQWTGTSGSNWNTAANWTCLTVPVSTDNVSIPVTATPPAILSSATGTVGSLTIAPSASLTLNTASQLTVSGNLVNNGTVSGSGVIYLNGAAPTITGNGTVSNITLNNSTGATIGTSDTLGVTGILLLNSGTLTTNGRLMLVSNGSGNGTIGTISGGSISGKVVVQQYITGGRRAYRFWAHPFNAAIPLSQVENYIDITGVGGALNGFTTTTSNAPSAYWYNPLVGNSSSGSDPGWTAFTSTNGAAANAFGRYEGIRLFIRGSKGEGLTGATYTIDPVTIRMYGYVNTGTQAVTLTKGTGAFEDYNLVGNPYPSVTDIGTVINNASVAGLVTGGAFYVWDPYYATAGQFVTKTIGSAYYLGPDESFEVRTVTNGNALTFAETNKGISVSDGLMRDAADYLTLFIYDTNYHPWDQLNIKFTDLATDNEDAKYDGAKPPGPASLNFYSWSADSVKLSLDCRPFTSGKVIPLGITSGYAQQFIIKASNVAVPDGGSVYLHDKFLHTYTLLQQGTGYPFSITTDPASQGDNRFELQLGNQEMQNPGDALSVQIVPNPAVSDITVSYAAPSLAATSIRITAITGETVLSRDLGIQQNGVEKISVGELSQGIYFVNFLSGNYSKVSKLIIE